MRIPKTFCVTLLNTPGRTNQCKDYFSGIGLECEFFYGVDGRQLNLQQLNVYDKCGWRVRNGVVGTTLSHRLLWITLLTMNYNEILILEDDVLFVPDFKEKFECYSDELPMEWDMVYLGGGFSPQNSGTKQVISEHILKYKPTGTYAYMIKKCILNKCLSYTDNSLIDIDVNMTNGLLNNVNIYAFNPLLATDRSVNGGEYIKTGIWKSLTYNWDGIR